MTVQSDVKVGILDLSYKTIASLVNTFLDLYRFFRFVSGLKGRLVRSNLR